MKKLLLIPLVLFFFCSCTKIGLFGTDASSNSQNGNGSGHSAVAYTPMVSSGLSHSCALNSSGEVFCWGKNNVGQLGYDDNSNRGDASGEMSALAAVNLGESVTKVATGYNHTCALLGSDHVKCWGDNSSGQLGYNDHTNRGNSVGSMAALSEISFGQDITDLVAGGYMTCVILADSSLKCWGGNGWGQLGYDDTTARGGSSGDMAGLAAVNLGQTVKKVAIGGSHTCAILADDTVRCWGRNTNGQLGYDDNLQRGHTAGSMASLTAVNLGQGAKEIIAGERHTCAILADNSAKCWGWNPLGQLGQGHSNSIGDTAGSMAALSAIPFGQTVKQMRASYYGTCAILADDTLRCFGDNDYGQLGLEDYNYRGDDAGEIAALTAIPLGATVKYVSSGETFNCALLSTDSIKCWGYAGYGSLGSDDTSDRGGTAGSMAALVSFDFEP